MKLLISLLVVIAPTVFTAPPTRHHIHRHHHYSSSPSTISFKNIQSSRRSPPSSTSSLHFPPTSSSSNRPRVASPSATGYASYETSLKLGPNEFLIPSLPQRPSLYDQDPASMVPGLIITRLAEDFARLTAQGLRSRETRIPVYVAVSEEDDDGLPTAKSIPKLLHLLDATSQKHKDTALYEEVQPLAGVDPQSYRDKAPIDTGIPVIEVNSDNPTSNPNAYQTPTISDKHPSTSVPSSPSSAASSSNDDPTIAVAVATPVATSAESSVPSTSSSQKEPIGNVAAKAELEVISKIHHLIEKQQETLFKQHVENVIKDHLVNLVKQHVNQALAQASAGRGHQETSNRQAHYVDHVTASANNQRHSAPSAQSGKISVGEKANLHQHNAMYRLAESAESVDKVTAQMIHQIKGQLDQLNSQLNQTVSALPASAPTPAPHKTPAAPSTIQLTPEVIKEAVIAAAKEAERRTWAEEQVRRMTEHLAEEDLHAVEQRNLIHNIMHRFRHPRDIDDRSMEVHAHEEEEASLPDPSEQYEYHREESSSNVPETISIPVVLLPQRDTDAISHDRYHHEGDADASNQESNEEEDQEKKKK